MTYYEVLLTFAAGARRGYPWSVEAHGRATRANLAIYVERAQRQAARLGHTIIRADLYCNRTDVTVATWTP